MKNLFVKYLLIAFVLAFGGAQEVNAFTFSKGENTASCFHFSEASSFLAPTSDNNTHLVLHEVAPHSSNHLEFTETIDETESRKTVPQSKKTSLNNFHTHFNRTELIGRIYFTKKTTPSYAFNTRTNTCRYIVFQVFRI